MRTEINGMYSYATVISGKDFRHFSFAVRAARSLITSCDLNAHLLLQIGHGEPIALKLIVVVLGKLFMPLPDNR